MIDSAPPEAATVDRRAAAQDGTVWAAPGDPSLWLVRHGESTWNTRGLAQGHNDEARLTRRGVVQARVVASELGRRPIGTLYASDLRRAVETADPLASVLGLPVIRDARLRERCLGVLEGSDVAAIGPEANGIRAHRVVDPDARPDGGESLRDFYQRVASFVDDLAGRPRPESDAQPGAGGPDHDIAVVAHGGTLRMLRACLNDVPVEEMAWVPLSNGTILRSPVTRRDRLTNPHQTNKENSI